jgi:hypothetical protein
MKCASIAFLLAGFASSAVPEAAIPYFSNVRDVQVSQPDRQNYLVVDEEIWAHARPDLADLRLYDGDVQVQFALSEQYGGVSTEQQEGKILNLGSIAGHTEFDIDVGAITEYDRVRLRLDAKDFVATASVAGSNALGQAPTTELGPSTLYDFTREALGSNSMLKMPPSSFRYLHVKLSPGIRPQQVKGASVSNLHEKQAGWTNVGSCASPEQKPRSTVITCDLPDKVPLHRILFQVASTQVNFRRAVSVVDAKGLQVGAHRSRWHAGHVGGSGGECLRQACWQAHAYRRQCRQSASAANQRAAVLRRAPRLLRPTRQDHVEVVLRGRETFGARVRLCQVLPPGRICRARPAQPGRA